MPDFITVPKWGDFPELVHGFGTAFAGMDGLEDDDEALLENRKAGTVRLAADRAIALSGPTFDKVLTVKQIHSPNLLVIRKGDSCVPESEGIRCDGIITDRPGLLIAVKTADCLPIAVYDPVNKVIAAVHSGWRGTARKILMKALLRMQKEFGSEMEDIHIAFGPAIQVKDYEVSKELADSFERLFGPEVVLKNTGAHVDLVAANRIMAEKTGVRGSSIASVGLSTASCCSPLFYSYRRDKGKTGRLLNYIGLRNPASFPPSQE